MSTLNDRIKELRKEKGFTQSQLADMLGVTDKAISKWEVGETNPDISLLPELSKIFGVTIDYLLTGKTEDLISLDDMDEKKRLSWIIKRDDVENFKKYKYLDSAYLFGKQQSYRPNTSYGCNYDFKIVNLNVQTWKEIISNDANKILNVSFDEMLSKNAMNNCWLAFTIIDCLDEFIVASIKNDRADVLEALGVKAFSIGANKNNNVILLGPTEYVDDTQVYCMSEDTFKFFFEMKDKSPKCYKYITNLSLKDVTLQTRALNNKDTREQYVVTYLERNLLKYAIEYKDFDVVKSIMTIFKEANEHVKSLLANATSGGWTKDYKLTKNSYVIYTNRGYYSGPYPIDGRVFKYSSDMIDKLIVDGYVDLAREMILVNKDYNEFIAKKITNDGNSNSIAYVLTDNEIDRKIKLNSSDITSEEKKLLNCVNEYIIKVDALKASDDIKFVKKILDNYYLNYYEFAFKSITKKDVRQLFEFLVDNEFDQLASQLLEGERKYGGFLSSCWDTFNASKSAQYKEHKILLDKQNNLPNMDDYFGYTNLARKSTTLGDNTYLNLMEEEKNKILKYVEEKIAAERKAKEEAEERAKIVEGLDRDYFDKLLKNDNIEIFIIKLCSLFDAQLRFDYHFDGVDFAERMNQYFAMLNDKAPKSRDMDDGWGYYVLDDKYENEVVIPEKNRIRHLSDIFNRLRIQRNNIAHSEKKSVEELSIYELNECLDHVFRK